AHVPAGHGGGAQGALHALRARGEPPARRRAGRALERPTDRAVSPLAARLDRAGGRLRRALTCIATPPRRTGSSPRPSWRGALARPHVARVLVERGVSADIGEAFDRYLGRGRPGYVEKPLPTLQQVTELVHAVGGLAVAAHLGTHGSEGQIRLFKQHGLDGLEVRHPSHPPAMEARLTRMAERLRLATSGGSD